MNFKIDENLPAELGHLLAAAGHDAPTVLDQNLGGQPDRRIMEVCKIEKRTLITIDNDFADVRTYPPHDCSGIIVLRLSRQDKPFVLDTVRRSVPTIGMETLDGRLWIVEDQRIRIRS